MGLERSLMGLASAAVDRLNENMRGARSAEIVGDVEGAWELLEQAHILSQPSAWLHVRVHASMLGLAWRTRDTVEIRGQLLRLSVAGPGSVLGRYPVGNTGRSNVPATLPMRVPPELEKLLAGDGPAADD